MTRQVFSGILGLIFPIIRPVHSAAITPKQSTARLSGDLRPPRTPVARAFLFHPQQVTEDGADGSLTIRFHASGHLEMAWHLYQWGDAVEVLSPISLRDLVAQHRCGDFVALP